MGKRAREQVNQESSPSNSDSVLYPIYIFPANPIYRIDAHLLAPFNTQVNPAVSDVCAQPQHRVHRTQRSTVDFAT